MSALEEESTELPPSPDEIAEQNVDALPQQRFNAFTAGEGSESRWPRARKMAAQSIVRITHALDAVVVGPSLYVSDTEKARRNEERSAVGLKPKN